MSTPSAIAQLKVNGFKNKISQFDIQKTDKDTGDNLLHLLIRQGDLEKIKILLLIPNCKDLFLRENTQKIRPFTLLESGVSVEDITIILKNVWDILEKAHSDKGVYLRIILDLFYQAESNERIIYTLQSLAVDRSEQVLIQNLLTDAEKEFLCTKVKQAVTEENIALISAYQEAGLLRCISDQALLSSLLSCVMHSNDVDKEVLVVRLLEAEGIISISNSDQKYPNPLHQAIEQKKIKWLKLLLENGSYPNQCALNNEDYHPLKFAQSLPEDDEVQDIIQLLKKYGSRTDIAQLQEYAHSNDGVSLKKAFVQQNLINEIDLLPLMGTLCRQGYADEWVNDYQICFRPEAILDEEGMGVLDYAVQSNQVATAKKLLPEILRIRPQTRLARPLSDCLIASHFKLLDLLMHYGFRLNAEDFRVIQQKIEESETNLNWKFYFEKLKEFDFSDLNKDRPEHTEFLAFILKRFPDELDAIETIVSLGWDQQKEIDGKNIIVHAIETSLKTNDVRVFLSVFRAAQSQDALSSEGLSKGLTAILNHFPYTDSSDAIAGHLIHEYEKNKLAELLELGFCSEQARFITTLIQNILHEKATLENRMKFLSVISELLEAKAKKEDSKQDIFFFIHLNKFLVHLVDGLSIIEDRKEFARALTETIQTKQKLISNDSTVKIFGFTLLADKFFLYMLLGLASNVYSDDLTATKNKVLAGLNAKIFNTNELRLLAILFLYRTFVMETIRKAQIDVQAKSVTDLCISSLSTDYNTSAEYLTKLKTLLMQAMLDLERSVEIKTLIRLLSYLPVTISESFWQEGLIDPEFSKKLASTHPEGKSENIGKLFSTEVRFLDLFVYLGDLELIETLRQAIGTEILCQFSVGEKRELSDEADKIIDLIRISHDPAKARRAAMLLGDQPRPAFFMGALVGACVFENDLETLDLMRHYPDLYFPLCLSIQNQKFDAAMRLLENPRLNFSIQEASDDQRLLEKAYQTYSQLPEEESEQQKAFKTLLIKLAEKKSFQINPDLLIQMKNNGHLWLVEPLLKQWAEMNSKDDQSLFSELSRAFCFGLDLHHMISEEEDETSLELITLYLQSGAGLLWRNSQNENAWQLANRLKKPKIIALFKSEIHQRYFSLLEETFNAAASEELISEAKELQSPELGDEMLIPIAEPVEDESAEVHAGQQGEEEQAKKGPGLVRRKLTVVGQNPSLQNSSFWSKSRENGSPEKEKSSRCTIL